MPTTGSHQQYKTKLIDCFDKAKELRRMHFRQTWEARQRGDLVIMGLAEHFQALPAGFGNAAFPSYGPYFSGIMKDPAQTVKCIEVAEARGYGRETCCFMRVHLGQMFQGLSTKSPLGGTVKPDFILQVDFCPHCANMGRIAGEYLGVPFVCVDVPYTDTPANREYLVAQFHETIERIEKITGRKHDDEKLIEGIKNEWETLRLWANICILNQAVPAPLDVRLLMALQRPGLTMRHYKETADFYRILLDEVKDRVSQGISARGIEKARLTIEPNVPLFALNLLNYPLNYGAVFVAGYVGFVAAGAFAVTPDGKWQAPKTIQEMGLPLKSRDDALRALVELYIGNETTLYLYNAQRRAAHAVQRARQWKADGSIYHVIRGCRALDCWVPEAKLMSLEAGIPATVMEGGHADPRDYNESETLRRFDTFLESLGLSKLT